MKTLNDKVVVITGAGSGIGQALAHQMAAAGAKLALNDWQEDDLAATVEAIHAEYDADVMTQSFDVADLSAFTDFKNAVVDKFGQVDVVINNAGVALSQTIEDVSIEDFEWIMGVNFWGMVYGTKLFLPELKQQKEASLVNVSSVFGLISVPTQGTYNASKFAVRGITEALWAELHGTKVTALSVLPGGIKTNIAKNAKFFIDPNGGKNRDKGLVAFDKNTHTTPEKAAELIVQAIKKRKKQLLIGTDAHIISRIQRLNPINYWSIIRRLQR